MNELLAARHFTLPLACLLLLCTAGLENGFGADPPDGRSTAPSTSVPSAKRLVESDSLQVDYGSQLPRSTPLSPAEALKHFHVEPGYRLELVAAEPAVTDPIALAFDESGRMFVVEMRGYSEQRDERLGRIRCLEDRDADGTFETSWTVIEGLSWPTAIAVHRGGLLIGMPPDILWFSTLPPGPQGESPSGKPLTVADGELVFRGFGHQNVQGMLNSFRWGLDLRVYGSSGTNGGRVQMIRFPQSPQIDLQRRDFAIEMPTMRMQPVTGGGQHGMSFDRWGDRYVSSNSDHLQWVRYPLRYLERNPQLEYGRPVVSIAVDGPAAPVFRTSPIEPWRVVRTRLRVKGIVGGPIEGGGRPAGYFTGATGVTIYTGDALDGPFRSETIAFVGDVGSNLVHCKRIVDRGLSKEGIRLFERREIVSSSDTWFRPVQFANGPDGALYILDMYREVIEHPLSLPPVIKRHLDLTSGRDRGRIYRLVPDGFRHPIRALPAEKGPDQWVTMLGHANRWHRMTAARLIYEHGMTPALVELLRVAARDAAQPDARLHALYLLAQCGQLDTATLLDTLGDPQSHVRRHSLILAEGLITDETIVRRMLGMVEDEDIRVRQQLAWTLGELPRDRRVEPLVRLADRDLAQEPMQVAILSSLADARALFLEKALQHEGLLRRSAAEPFIDRLCRQVGRAGSGDELAATLRELDAYRSRTTTSAGQTAEGRDWQVAWWISAVLDATGRSGDALDRWLTRVLADEEDRRRATALTQFAQQTLIRQARAGTDVAARAKTLGRLGWARFDDLLPLVEQTLLASVDAELQQSAVDLALRDETKEGVALLLDRIGQLDPVVRRAALEKLTRQDDAAWRLMQAVAGGKVPAQSIPIPVQTGLRAHRDQRVRELAEAHFAQLDDRLSVVRKYEQVLRMTGNVARGKELFVKTCASCHQLSGLGSVVGPDLRPLRARGAHYLLTQILDPNRQVDPRYESVTVETTDGQVISGIPTDAGQSVLELQQADGRKVRLERARIDTVTPTGKSLMPEGLERELDPQAMADLLAWLLDDPM